MREQEFDTERVAMDGGEAVVIEYLQNIRELAEAQRQVVLGYLGASEPAREGVRREIPARARSAGTPSRPAEAPAEAPVPTAPSAPERAPEPEVDIPLSRMLLELVSERTGYPPEMLDVDLDLEADLSIDSIKRIEILGALNERIGLAGRLGDDRDELLEELSQIKTLRGIEEWIESRVGEGASRPGEEPGVGAAREPEASEGGGGGPPTVTAVGSPAGGGSERPDPGAAAADAPVTSEVAAAPVQRLRVEIQSVPLPEKNGIDLEGATFAVTEDPVGVARELEVLLTERGARVRVIAPGETPSDVDGVIHLTPLGTDDGPGHVKTLFSLAKAVAGRPARWLVGVTALGGSLGVGADGDTRLGGIGGLLRSLSKEWPDGVVRAVDVDASEGPRAVAERVLDELTVHGGPVEIGYANGERRSATLVPAPLNGAAEGLGLGRDAVVLVTGGARGITSRVAVELARRYGCRLELVGRSPLPSPTEPELTAGIQDPTALRRRLVEADPGAGPAEIESRLRRLLADREIRETLAEIDQAGAPVAYHSVDVRDAEAFGKVIETIYEERGRVDGVIHGAGTIDDKLLSRKTRESFDRVFDTKVNGALTLERHLRDGTRFVVFFSSVAGVYGNRGQTDYAAANDLLDKLALRLNRRIEGRAVSVAWGPWGGAGMVTPELEREYERRGIGLIPLEEGVRSLIDELERGPESEPNVVIVSGAGVDRR